jgi:hypothetical protein
MMKLIVLIAYIIGLAASFSTSIYTKNRRNVNLHGLFCADGGSPNDIPNDDANASNLNIATTTPPTVPDTPLFTQKKLVASASAVVASIAFVFQHSQPASSVALLKAMERDSVTVKVFETEYVSHPSSSDP